jgi:hypothetical protein
MPAADPVDAAEAIAATYEYLAAVHIRKEVPGECPAAVGLAMAHMIAEGLAGEYVAAGMSSRQASASVRAVIAKLAFAAGEGG